MKTKLIFVTGGVVSSLGKGLASASVGALLECRGLKITLMKLDPYINVDPGTMNPLQHGEVFVTDDGAETDLDLGHYERFTHAKLSKLSNITTGKIYHSVIEKERRGEYLGKTVQVIPHITDEIKSRIIRATQDVDLGIIEIGGTVGDIESLPFLEAIRQLRYDLGKENVLYIHLTLIPHMDTSGELKTKPTQHSVQKLREIGIQPDILLCRTKLPLNQEIKSKIALFCNVNPDCVFQAIDVKSIYQVPLEFREEGIDEKIIELLNIWTKAPDLKPWEDLINRINHPTHEIKIGVVGKYVDLTDSYKSLNEALIHGGIENDCKVLLKFVDSEKLEALPEVSTAFQDVDAILVPGGFGNRGIEGKIKAIQYARENKVPFFGICLGMQLACIEFARHVCRLREANSKEFDPNTAHPIIALMEQQKAVINKGATMRLGAYLCRIKKGTLANRIYGETEISERHRHRYEFNNEYLDRLGAKGMVFSGTSPDGSLVEIVEIKKHPWFLGCQFHPEFKSKPMTAHPIFSNFIAHALKCRVKADWKDLKEKKLTKGLTLESSGKNPQETQERTAKS
ncbi:MAG: CTP synthase [Deltaproteobacteria bacterium]|nr:CTP synthase [Deltaproteobacteria bacterium]